MSRRGGATEAPLFGAARRKLQQRERRCDDDGMGGEEAGRADAHGPWQEAADPPSAQDWFLNCFVPLARRGGDNSYRQDTLNGGNMDCDQEEPPGEPPVKRQKQAESELREVECEASAFTSQRPALWTVQVCCLFCYVRARACGAAAGTH